MARFPLPASAVLLALLQAGCATSPERPVGLRSSPLPIHPTCDTSVEYIDLIVRIDNPGGGAATFSLKDGGGPPFDPSYTAYRVHASAPGQPYQLVHDSGHGSEWDRKISIAPGGSALFHTPIFGLRPSDYSNYFRIEFRDAHNRSRWTPEFELCAYSAARCICPGADPKAACPAAPPGTVGKEQSSGGISLVCR